MSTDQDRSARRGPYRSPHNATATITPVIPKVPDALQVAEFEEAMPGLFQFFDRPSIPLACFSDEDLARVANTWTKALLAEARKQREEGAPDEKEPGS